MRKLLKFFRTFADARTIAKETQRTAANLFHVVEDVHESRKEVTFVVLPQLQEGHFEWKCCQFPIVMLAQYTHRLFTFLNLPVSNHPPVDVVTTYLRNL